MLKIRLARKGVRRKAFYHIVAIDERKKITGIALEVLGYYQKSTGIKKINSQALKKWVLSGAGVTKAVEALLK